MAFRPGDAGDVAELDGERNLWRVVALQEVELEFAQDEKLLGPVQALEHAFLFDLGPTIFDHLVRTSTGLLTHATGERGCGARSRRRLQSQSGHVARKVTADRRREVEAGAICRGTRGRTRVHELACRINASRIAHCQSNSLHVAEDESSFWVCGSALSGCEAPRSDIVMTDKEVTATKKIELRGNYGELTVMSATKP